LIFLFLIFVGALFLLPCFGALLCVGIDVWRGVYHPILCPVLIGALLSMLQPIGYLFYYLNYGISSGSSPASIASNISYGLVVPTAFFFVAATIVAMIAYFLGYKLVGKKPEQSFNISGDNVPHDASRETGNPYQPSR